MNWIALIAIIFSLIVLYILGSFALWIARIKPQTDAFCDTFFRLILGLIISTTIYASIVTSFNTIQIGFFIIGVCCIVYKSKIGDLCKYPISEILYISKTHILCFFVVLLSAIIYFLFNGYDFYDSPWNRDLHDDYYFYSALGELMVERGTETTMVFKDLLVKLNLVPTPYHYIEIWFAMLIGLVFKINVSEILFVVVYAILCCIYIIGLISIVRNFCTKISMQFLVVFALTFVPIAFFNYEVANPLQIIDFSTYSPITNTKTLIVAVFLLFSLLIFLKNKRLFILSLLCLPIVNIALAPAIFSAIGFMLLLRIIFCKEKKIEIFNLIVSIIFACAIIAFYFLQSANIETLGAFSNSDIILENIMNKKIIIVKSTIKFICLLLMFHLPLLVLWLVCYFSDKQKTLASFKKIAELYIIIPLFLIIAFMFSQVVMGISNHSQFFSIPILVLPAFYLLNFVCIEETTNLWGIKIGLVVFYIVFAVIDSTKINVFHCYKLRYDLRYIDNICKVEVKNKIGVSLINVNSYSPAQGLHFGHPFQVCGQISEMNFKTICINVMDIIPLANYSPTIWSEIYNSTFYKYVEDYRKNENNMASVDEIQYKFIKENKIEYIIAERGVILPDILETLVDTILTDNKTGERFMYLKE